MSTDTTDILPQCIDVYIDASSDHVAGFAVAAIYIPGQDDLFRYIPYTTHADLVGQDGLELVAEINSTTIEMLGASVFLEKLIKHPNVTYNIHTDCMKVTRTDFGRDDINIIHVQGHNKKDLMDKHFRVVDLKSRKLMRHIRDKFKK